VSYALVFEGIQARLIKIFDFKREVCEALLRIGYSHRTQKSSIKAALVFFCMRSKK